MDTWIYLALALFTMWSLLRRQAALLAASSVSTAPLTAVTFAAAASGGQVSANGNVIVARGVAYGTASAPTVYGPKTVDGAGEGAFVSAIAGLAASTAYFVRAYAIGDDGRVFYGNELTFQTAAGPVVPVALPVVTTGTITQLLAGSATAGGTVAGAGTVSVRGVLFYPAANPAAVVRVNAATAGLGAFSVGLTGLTQGTAYLAQAYASNETGETLGLTVAFTAPVPAAPSVLTHGPAFGLSGSGASVGGFVNENGAAVTVRGIAYNTVASVLGGTHVDAVGGGAGLFHVDLTGLAPVTMYWAGAYATNSVGTSYATNPLVQFTTPAGLPTVTTMAALASVAGSTTLDSGGEVTSDGGAALTARGIVLSLGATLPTLAANDILITEGGTAVGAFFAYATGLAGFTTYTVRAYATNSAGTAYGAAVALTTLPSPPTVETVTFGAGYSSLAMQGDVTSTGGDPATVRGAVFKIGSAVTLADLTGGAGIIVVPAATVGSGPYDVLHNLVSIGFVPEQTYHVAAYATNGLGSVLGSAGLVKLDAVTLANPLTNLLPTSATASCHFPPSTLLVPSGAGVCYSVTDTVPHHTLVGTSICQPLLTLPVTENFVVQLEGLIFSTTYYVRPYVKNGATYHYGDALKVFQFTTPPLAPEITVASSLVGDNTATFTANVVGAYTERGFKYGAFADVAINPASGHIVVPGTGTGGSFSNAVTDLQPNTMYYLVAYATNAGGTTFSTPLEQFNTDPLHPVIVTTLPSTLISFQTATLNAVLNEGATLAEHGFYWSEDANPVTPDNPHFSSHKVSLGPVSIEGAFAKAVANLPQGKVLYVQAFAKQASAGEVLGLVVTMPVTDQVTTVLASAVTATTATVANAVVAAVPADILARGVCVGTSLNPVVNLVTPNNFSDTQGPLNAGNGTSAIIGLTASTVYHARAYVQTILGFYYGADVAFTTVA